MSAPPTSRPEDVVRFWREAGMAKWFSKDPAFDAEFEERFSTLHEEAAAGRLVTWLNEAESALALVLLLDQFPRNCFRGTPRMFETDPLARHYADRAIALGFDERVPQELRFFFYLPFMHSEALADQERCVLLHERIGFTPHAIEHRDIIQRFGRFPHRNAVLGRSTTPEEQTFLDAGGFAG